MKRKSIKSWFRNRVPSQKAKRSRTSGRERALTFQRLESRQLMVGDLLWAQGTGGVEDDQGHGVAVDVAGNVYTTGYFERTIVFGQDPFFALTSNGGEDLFVTKTAPDGTVIWARSIGGSASDQGNAITVDSVGNVIIGGKFSGTVDLNPGSAIASRTSVGTSDRFLLKLDTNGNYVWDRHYRDPALMTIESVALDASGNVFATGYFEGTVDFAPGVAGGDLTAVDHDGYIVKVNSSGNYVWARQIGNTGFDASHAITTDSAGNVFTTGVFSGAVDFDPGAGTSILSNSLQPDTFVYKLNAGGNFVWAKQFLGNRLQGGSAIDVDGLGNVYTAGGFEDTVDFDPGAGTARFNLTSSGNSDVFVSKLNSSGNFVWAKKMGGSGEDLATGMAVDSRGNVYTTGTFEGTSDFNPGTARTDLTSFGGVDAFISKLNVDGNHVFSRQQGGAGNDFANSLALDDWGNILTTGHFESTADFDPRGGRLDITSNGTTDIFVSKLTQEIVYHASETSNRFELRRNGTTLELLDRVSMTVLVTRPLSQVYGVRILDGAYELTINYNFGGQFSLTNGLEFVGRSSLTDSITVLGTGTENVGYVPSTTYGNGSMTVSSGVDSLATISFSRIENAKVSRLNSIYFVSPGGADSMRSTLSTGHAGSTASRISGTSGGSPIVPLTFDNVASATLDLASRDSASSSADQFTFRAGGYSAAGLRTLDVFTGMGDDNLTVYGTSLNLPGGGAFTYHAGDQADELIISGDTNQNLRASAVDMGPGTGSLRFSSLEKATLIGGASANTLNAAGFGGTTKLYGEGGNDFLFGSSQADILYGGEGNDIIAGGLGNDSYQGQGGSDVYSLTGSAAADDLRLTRLNSTAASFVRKNRGATVALETDLFVYDSSDVFDINALAGNDLISIDLAFANLGSVNGGTDTDTCTAPSSWTRISCEL
ncbi:MAG: hypothetical protein ABL888_04510 [Pirellulaceae bacterium]